MEVNGSKQTQNGKLPLTIWMTGSGEALLYKTLLREVPAKRYVILGYWGDKQVIAKLFYRFPDAKRELIRSDSLQNVGVKTPALLYHGWARHHSLYILVYEKIEPAEDFDTAWWTGDSQQREDILRALLMATASLHQAGFMQRDMHLKNFLLSRSQVYVIDTADIVKTADGQPLPERSSLKNLGRMFAQFSPQDDQYCAFWYKEYANARGFVYTTAKSLLLMKWISYWRKHHFRVYGKKVLRSTSNLQSYRSWSNFTVYDRAYESESLRAMLADPDQYMKTENAKLLKAGNTCTVVCVEVDDKLFVIKRFNMKSFWHRLKRAFRPSRAHICWRNAMVLASWRIGVPQPVAMIEKRLGFLRSKAYFISVYVPGMSLNEYCFNHNRSPEQLMEIAKQLTQLFAGFASARISHGDLKATNILLTDNGPVLLDLDAMCSHRSIRSWRKAAKEDWKRFMENWDNHPDIAKIFS